MLDQWRTFLETQLGWGYGEPVSVVVEETNKTAFSVRLRCSPEAFASGDFARMSWPEDAFRREPEAVLTKKKKEDDLAKAPLFLERPITHPRLLQAHTAAPRECQHQPPRPTPLLRRPALADVKRTNRGFATHIEVYHLRLESRNPAHRIHDASHETPPSSFIDLNQVHVLNFITDVRPVNTHYYSRPQR